MSPPNSTLSNGMQTPVMAVHGLYAIADSTWLAPDNLLVQVGAALAGGAHLVQYRDKHQNPQARLRMARSLVRLCNEYSAPLIINDDPELARACGAAGVHLGRDDADPAAARELLGRDAIIGVSCYNELERARRAQEQGADYVAFGRFFPSHTKPDAVPASLALLQRAHVEIDVPVVAIGGITPENGAALVAAGAHALAVIEGLWGQPDARAAAARYVTLFTERNN